MYKLVKILRNILRKAPLGVPLLLGEALGLIFYLNGRKRRTAFKNIKMAFPQKTGRQIRQIMRASFRNLGLSIIEMLIAPRLSNYVEIRGKENISKEEGGILVGIHEGNYELFNTVFTRDFKLAVLARKQKKKNFDNLLNELRQECNITVYFSLKNLIQPLKNNEIIGLIVDHGAEDNAHLAGFFSQLVPTPGGAVYLSKKFNKKIYPGFTYRVKGFHHIGEVYEPLSPQGKTTIEMLNHLNQLYENTLKKHPQEYIWSYKRFKRKKTLDVLLLSDGKTGHIKQSKALLSFLKESDYTVRDKTVQIRYRNAPLRSFSEICAFFSTKNCLGCGCCLKAILNSRTYNELQKIYADIVISTGSSLASINRLFASYIGAKSVVVLRPNIPLKKFDLAIIPEHDRLYTKNIVKIKGALVYPQNVEEKVSSCRHFFKLKPDKKISLFLGGPLHDKPEFLSNLNIFIENLMQFSKNKGYKLLISTSRRTPQEAELIIEEKLSNFKNTEALIYPAKTNYDFVFDGFTSLSDIVFVSTESISMVSEIISLRKPCVCVAFESPDEKHDIFLQSIKEEVNFLKKPFMIKDIEQLKIPDIFDKNKAIIKTAIKNIL